MGGDLFLEAARGRLAVLHVLAAGVGRHGEAGRHGDSELGHLGQADALAAEKLSPSAGRLVEVVDEAPLPSHCEDLPTRRAASHSCRLHLIPLLLHIRAVAAPVSSSR